MTMVVPFRKEKAIAGDGSVPNHHRVPVLTQMNATECGAACLAMLLSYHGRKTKVSECRPYCGVGRDGVTAQKIKRAAQHFGLITKAYSVKNLEHLNDLPTPSIIHWCFNHFVVLEAFMPDSVQIVDPAVGRRLVSRSEFQKNFTGIILTFAVNSNHKLQSQKRSPIWHRYFRQVLTIPKTYQTLLQILLTSVILQFLGLALPVFTKILIDRVIPFQMTNLMWIIALGFMLLVGTQMVTSYLRTALLIFLQARVDKQLMLGFFNHLLSLPLLFFQNRPAGDLLMRLGSNVTVRELFTAQTLTVVLDGTLVVLYLIILLTIYPWFAVLSLVIGLLQMALMFATKQKAHYLTQEHVLAQSREQSYVVEALNGIATIKASGSEQRALESWQNLFSKQLNLSLLRNRFLTHVDILLNSLRTLSPLLLLWLGVHAVLANVLTVGTMLALTSLAGAFLAPLSSIAGNAQRFFLAATHLERLEDVFEAGPEQDAGKTKSDFSIKGKIALQHVSFSYNSDAAEILHDISVTVQPGQKAAIVGKTGAGKSTLAKLLLGLYPPKKGNILFDDVSLAKLNYRALRNQFGVVLQEPTLFHGSIRQNISFHQPDMPFEAVMEAARLAVIHDEIMQMPMGYETLISEHGDNISGGQRQRLAIARALARQPKVLMFDEATSHLDAVTEQKIAENLSKLACTRIVIAHRLSTIQDADLILVLDNGFIAEQGSHADLLALNGAYVELMQSQLV